MKFIIVFALALLSFSSGGYAQFFKQKLEEIKLSAKQKINDRIDQKSNQAMDSVMDKSERTVGGKMKSKKKRKKSPPEKTTEDAAPVEATEEITQQPEQTN